MKIADYLREAGIEKSDLDYGGQFNLTHASLSGFGIRNGLDERVKAVLKAHGLGGMTDAGRKEFAGFLKELVGRLDTRGAN